jgi:hypothetical protein
VFYDICFQPAFNPGGTVHIDTIIRGAIGFIYINGATTNVIDVAIYYVIN